MLGRSILSDLKSVLAYIPHWPPLLSCKKTLTISGFLIANSSSLCFLIQSSVKLSCFIASFASVYDILQLFISIRYMILLPTLMISHPLSERLPSNLINFIFVPAP